MSIQKGYCRLKLKNGVLVFGEVLEIKDKYFLFLSFDPSAIERRISIKNIVEFEPYREDDIPVYE